MFTIIASLDGIRFAEGRPFDQSVEIITPTGNGIPPNDVALIAKIIGILLIFSFLTSVVMLFISKEARKKFLRWIIIGALIFIIASLPRSGQQGTTAPDQPNNVEITPLAGLSSDGESSIIIEEIKEPPNWVINILSYFISIILVGVIAAIYLSKKTSKPLDKVAKEVEKAIEAIETGADYKDIIIRCYYEMGQALSKDQNLTREKEMTPREFERLLVDHGFPKGEVHNLTVLFEKVRYGSKQSSKDDEKIAVESLKAILNNIS